MTAPTTARLAGLLRAALVAGALTILPISRLLSSAQADTSPLTTVAPSGPTAALVSGLKVMNYYTSTNSWANMWTTWNPSAIDGDFARIAALHANTVRVIVQAGTFGYPTPNPAMQAHLAQMVSLAQARGLRVQLTLFDWWGQYSDIAGSKAWAQAILAPFAGNHEIAFVELQNEIDPSNPAVLAWTEQMLPFLKSVDGGLPETVSVYTLSGLQILANALRATPPDFYDFHYYGHAGDAFGQLAQAKAMVSPSPLFIGETGFSSALSNTAVGGLADNAASLEAYQDFYYRSVQDAAGSLGLGFVAPWVLSDFTPGSLTWAPADSKEYGFGLYRTDGSAKPVAASVASAFAAGSVDTSFNNGFESCAAGMPAVWLTFHAGQASFACDSTTAHTGTSAVRISHSTGDNSGVPSFYTTPTAEQLTAGQTYTASVWAKGQASTGTNQIALAFFSATGAYLGTTASSALAAGTTTWSRLTVSATAPAGAASVPSAPRVSPQHGHGVVRRRDLPVSRERQGVARSSGSTSTLQGRRSSAVPCRERRGAV